MHLPAPEAGYSRENEAQTREALMRADRANRKAGEDLEIGDARLVLRSPNGTRWSVGVTNAGTITAAPL